jgi:hypothetical protein
MEKNRKVSEIIARRKRINQDGDENEERRGKTKETYQKKEGNEM